MERLLKLREGDALILTDIQRDFLPGGSLGILHGDEVIGPLNRAVEAFERSGLPVYATRDWHPADHCSFEAQGGPWPPHCVQGSPGAEFSGDLRLTREPKIISKATRSDKEAYSAFEGTELDEHLRSKDISRIFIGGLATDYCVLNTVKDAVRLGYQVVLLIDAVRAVNVRPHDEERALVEMEELGAASVRTSSLEALEPHVAAHG
jgi:nicotinamidase/pyrazinamidase